MKRQRYTSKRDHAEIARRQNGKCARCPEELVDGNYHIDHVIPVSPVLGGTDTLGNKQALCLACHRSKTIGRGATTAGSDIGNIAKTRRFLNGTCASRTPMPWGRKSNWKRARALSGVLEHCEEGRGRSTSRLSKVDWVICGGESGPHARPMHPDWVLSLRDQCATAGVPFHFKQWGEWRTRQGDRWGGYPPPCQSIGDEYLYRVGKKTAGRLLDGVEHNGFPNFERAAA